MAEAQRVGGRYGLEAEVGKGPLGVVHRGRLTSNAGFTRRVALKKLRPELAEDGEFTEALAKSLSVFMGFPHLHVEDAVDVVREGDAIWLVVDWCDGPSLTSWIEAHHERGNPAPFGQLLTIAVKILYGLHTLHGRGIVHGGVGSASIRLDRSGQPRLTRTGIRAALDASERDPDWGVSNGLARAAPEGRPSASGDVFAVGLVLYTALAGATDVAFLPEELQGRVMQGKPVDLALLRNDVPPVLLRTIERALRADPRERFESAAAMARALELILRAMPENNDPPVLAKGIAELFPAKRPPRPVPSAPARNAGAPPPPPDTGKHKRPPPKLGVSKESTDQLDVSDLEALRVGDEE